MSNKIKDHVFDKINNDQHVCHTKSSVTQLIEVFDYIGRELDHGKQVDVIYLDMSNAFDRVYLQALKSLVKLITEHRNEKKISNITNLELRYMGLF